MPTRELETLVINNLKLIEKIPGVTSIVDKKVMCAVDEYVGKTTKKISGWNSEPLENYEDDDFCVFGPASWVLSRDENVEGDEEGGDETEWQACYYLEANPVGDDDTYYVSSLTGATEETEFGIWFEIGDDWVTQVVTKKTKKNFWRDQLAKHPKLVEAGFRNEKDALFMPFHIEADTLANAYPDELEDTFGPIDEALKRLQSVHGEIEQIVEAFGAAFGHKAT